MFAKLRSFWRSAAKRREMEGDLDDEMRFHVEARTEQLMRERALPRCRASRGQRWRLERRVEAVRS